jgi:multidrug efflux system outer membrane protein
MLLSACTIVGPDFKRPEVPWLDALSGGSLESLSSEQGGERRGRIEEWWCTFNDLVLDRLITEGYCQVVGNVERGLLRRTLFVVN